VNGVSLGHHSHMESRREFKSDDEGNKNRKVVTLYEKTMILYQLCVCVSPSAVGLTVSSCFVLWSIYIFTLLESKWQYVVSRVYTLLTGVY
jgi:hypothetical protein